MHKYTAIYVSPDDINNLKIRIKILENDDCFEETIFDWQQKILGQFERNYYRDKRNCVTDLQKRYHEDVSKLPQSDSRIFTYTNADEVLVDLKECGEIEIMHFMADLSDSEPTILCTVKYNSTRKHFTIFPDFTQEQPYTVQIETDSKRIYRYYIEDASSNMPLETQLKENVILNKIFQHRHKLHLKKAGTDFLVPSKNKLNFYLFCEILTARNFEYNNIYVQYLIDLPKNWKCNDSSTLSGTTLSSTSDGLSYFGYPFEVHLECHLLEITEDEILKAPAIYFKVISKGSWDRFRTEGIANLVLPISRSGLYHYNLQCVRLSPRIQGDLRRFFIGDDFDFNWVSLLHEEPKTVTNKYDIVTTSTGELTIRMNVLQQSQAFATDAPNIKRNKFILEKLNTSGLIKSVEQVVTAFKIAKRKMIEAKKNI